MAISLSALRPEIDRTNSSLLNGILTRRSVHPKRLVEPGPDNTEIRLIADSASTATDHCGLRPWRLLAITGDTRNELAEVFANIKRQRNPKISPAELERERDRARAVPVLIAVITRLVTQHPIVPTMEQYACVGAAIQNMLLCAEGLGFGAKMVSGQKVGDPQLASAFGLDTDEAVFGFICLGTARADAPIRPRVANPDAVTYWVGNSPSKRPDHIRASEN